jgi:CBS domain-containing protein
MAEADVGSVMVMSGDKVEGIFTERLYARKVFLEGKAAPTTPVRDVMEANVICVRPEQSTEACMALMTEERISHLPVMSEDRLVGLVSIGDLMKNLVDARESRIDQLEEYISGRG